ncbi:hypothetical protein Mal52_32180 [Symmachiella dynata]|uniref:Uncharacterized protein n=1 Tax=Symmachiella dynata TaxID=2527995 RepID=A0A517ZQG1_9PLAN|nr:hypothetical protein Mal52_32180 [Symmachiella dynata]
MWHDSLFEGRYRRQAGGFVHGHRIASHAVAGVSDEVTADAAAGHHQTVHISRDQCGKRNVICLDPRRSITLHVSRIGTIGEDVVNIDGKIRPTDRIFVAQTGDDIIAAPATTDLKNRRW